MLVGRRSECDVLDELLEEARGGRSSVLVLRGEAGVGKTALVDYASGSAPGFRIVRAVGVESDVELAFAAPQQLCTPLLDRLERLPGPWQDALRAAFGLSASAQALAIVARRLLADRVALLFATRVQSDEFTGLPELLVEGTSPRARSSRVASYAASIAVVHES